MGLIVYKGYKIDDLHFSLNYHIGLMYDNLIFGGFGVITSIFGEIVTLVDYNEDDVFINHFNLREFDKLLVEGKYKLRV